MKKQNTARTAQDKNTELSRELEIVMFNVLNKHKPNPVEAMSSTLDAALQLIHKICGIMAGKSAADDIVVYVLQSVLDEIKKTKNN